jgi:phosphopantothenoylcysteine decarboxylase
MNILLGVTASVAATLTPKICRQLKDLGTIKLVYTEKALHFFDYFAVECAINGRDPESTSGMWNEKDIYSDEDEWMFSKYSKSTDILHIRLRDWADVFVIAPLTANTLAKISNGICDNLLTCVYRAWGEDKPIVIAPAMNTEMWNNPITGANISQLKKMKCVWFDKRGCGVSADPEEANLFCVTPISKKLACGQEGIGAMAQVDDIVAAVKLATNRLNNEKVEG